MQRARNETVDNEEILLDIQLRIAPLEITRSIILHSMAQDEILRSGRRANRISLHKFHLMKRALQRRWFEEIPRHGKLPQLFKRNRHWFSYAQDFCDRPPAMLLRSRRQLPKRS